MIRPARSRRSTSKSTFRPSSRIYFRPRRRVLGGNNPDRSIAAGVATFGLAAQNPQVKIDVQSGGASSSFPAALAEYSFDEASGDILDVTGNGHDITLGGGVSRGAGHTGTGIVSTDGAGLQITPVFGQTAERTLMFWAKDLPDVAQWLVQWNVTSLDSGSWGIVILSASVHCQARNADGFVRASVTRPTDGLWHHYACTYDGTNIKMYLDGSLADTQPITAPLRTDADELKILPTVTASMDDLRIYDSALDATTIGDISASPVGMDPTTDPPHIATFGMSAQDASVKITVNAGAALIDMPARNAIPVQNIACAWFETAITVDQHFCTVDLDSVEAAITLDAHEGVVGVEENYGEVAICGRP
jgi:hypothetical protein